MTNILSNESQNFLTANAIWQRSEVLALVLPKACNSYLQQHRLFPHLPHPGNNKQCLTHGQTIFKRYLDVFTAFPALNMLFSKFKINNFFIFLKRISLAVLACHFISHSHLFSCSQLETREKASNIQLLFTER